MNEECIELFCLASHHGSCHERYRTLKTGPVCGCSCHKEPYLSVIPTDKQLAHVAFRFWELAQNLKAAGTYERWEPTAHIFIDSVLARQPGFLHPITVALVETLTAIVKEESFNYTTVELLLAPHKDKLKENP